MAMMDATVAHDRLVADNRIDFRITRHRNDLTLHHRRIKQFWLGLANNIDISGAVAVATIKAAAIARSRILRHTDKITLIVIYRSPAMTIIGGREVLRVRAAGEAEQRCDNSNHEPRRTCDDG